MNYERTDCRLCAGSLTARLALTPTPPANAFAVSPDTLTQRYPLELNQCNGCEHVQLGYVLDGAELYAGYRYETPKAMSPYLEKAAQRLRIAHPNASTVLEIGSNNGLNADILRRYFNTVLEVDPAGTSPQAIKSPFTASFARNVIGIDLIVANHVFAHIDDLDDVFDGINACLSPEGALVFEVQYLPDLMARGAFDMIYHEHRDYHTLGPLARFARKHGFVLTDWMQTPTQGGSILVTMRRHGVQADLPPERLDWNAFIDRIAAEKAEIKRNVHGRVLLFGAAAKSCTLLHHCDIADRIEYAVDNTPAKQGRYIPGTDIRIFPEYTLYQSKSAKRMLLSAWNYADQITSSHPDLEFIIPFQPVVAAEAKP